MDPAADSLSDFWASRLCLPWRSGATSVGTRGVGGHLTTLTEPVLKRTNGKIHFIIHSFYSNLNVNRKSIKPPLLRRKMEDTGVDQHLAAWTTNITRPQYMRLQDWDGDLQHGGSTEDLALTIPPLAALADRKMLARLTCIRSYSSHPLHYTVEPLGSSFSILLRDLQCRKKH